MKTRILLTLAAVATMATASVRDAQAREDARNFWLLNETGHTIREVHLAGHGSDEAWGDDILGDSNLPNGLGTKIIFTGGSTCTFDFRIVYTDGSHEDYLQGRNLCRTSAIEFVPGGFNVGL
jgi:hypothetical protein